MKLNLSVVMNTIDNTSSKLQKITLNQSKYTKQIKELKEQSQKIGASQDLIKMYRATGREQSKNTSKLNVASDKLAKLNQRMKDVRKPSVAMQEQLKKQNLTVKNLTKIQSSYSKELAKTQNKMKAHKINVSRLTSEEKRLTKVYSSQIDKISKLSKKETRLLNIRKRLSNIKTPVLAGLKKTGATVLGVTSTFAGLMTVTNLQTSAMANMAKSYDMSIEKFTQWGAIAKQADLNGENVGDMVEELSNKFGEFKALGKNSAVSDVFGVLGLNKEMLEGKKATEQFEIVMKKLEKVKDKQQAGSMADMLFGGEANKLVTSIKNTKGGLSKLLAEQKQFNLLTKSGSSGAISYGKAFNNLKNTVGSAWQEIAGITGGEMAGEIQALTKKISAFVKANKTELVEGLKKVINTLKNVGKAFYFLSQHIPEVIAGLALLKIGMFALNAVMIANPVGLMIAGVAALSVGIIYLMQKCGILMPVIEGLWNGFKRIGAGVKFIVSSIIQNFLIIPRAIMKVVSLIPSSLLPDGWGKNIKSAQETLEGLNLTAQKFGNKNLKYAVTGSETLNKLETVSQKIKQPQVSNGGAKESVTNDPIIKKSNANPIAMLKHPTLQSKSQVDLRIKSDKPVEISKVKTDNSSNLNIDTGNLLGFGF